MIGFPVVGKKTNKLVFAEKATPLGIERIPADGEFHGFAAHAENGSIFRPSSGSKVELVWRDRRDDNLRQQTIQLPEFSPDVKNWYCYFTLNENQEWTAVFEGTLDEEIDH